MASSNQGLREKEMADSGPESSRKRARVPKGVGLIDLVDMELEKKQQSIPLNTEASGFPATAWAKKRTNLWIKDATKFLSFEPADKVGAGDAASDSQVVAHSQKDEVCINIPLPKMLHAYAEYREKCVICYHRSRALEDAEMEQWMLSDDASRDAVEHTWPLGQGFFAVKFYAKSEAEKYLLNGKMPFYDRLINVVPYVPCFFPNEERKQAWPVWVSFPCLPLFLTPFLQDIASGLGKVVYVPEARGTLTSISPRVCVLWEADKEAPSTVKVSFDQLGAMKLAVKFDSIPSYARCLQRGCENSKESNGLASLPPGNHGSREEGNANAESRPSPNGTEPLPSQKVKIYASPSSFQVLGRGPEPATVSPAKETRGSIFIASVSSLLPVKWVP